jgi:hypothetical protein
LHGAAFLKILGRIGLWAALAALTLLRLWVGVLGLAQLIGLGWAIGLALMLLLAGWLPALQIAVFFGALLAWHWPVLLALLLAAPRLILVLPGLISTLLAGRRHPRARWSSYKPA